MCYKLSVVSLSSFSFSFPVYFLIFVFVKLPPPFSLYLLHFHHFLLFSFLYLSFPHLGLICGVVALFVAFFTKTLSNFKFKVFHNLIEKEKTGEIMYGVAFLFFISCNCLFVVIAWMFVYIEPLAAGSGIPEVKCFLNGLNIPRVVRVKTLMYVMVMIRFRVSRLILYYDTGVFYGIIMFLKSYYLAIISSLSSL